jgi:ubiquinone biosynthesis accessory factor UbiJ
MAFLAGALEALASAQRACADMVAPAVMQRLTLLINHVIGRETVAMQRLAPHAGRRLVLAVQGWPAWAPPLPPLCLAVTPAGLFEGLFDPAGEPAEADLRVLVDVSNPLQLVPRLMQGQMPPVQIEGDAALAAEVNWLAEHLRWDIADDVQRWAGPAVAQGLSQVAATLKAGLPQAMASLSAMAQGLGRRSAQP